MTPKCPQSQASRSDATARFEAPQSANDLVMVATASLKLNPRNARTHSKKQVRQIADSIQQFGFNNPILVDNKLGVIAGHGRLQAAKILGLKEVPIVCLSHLNAAEKRAYILADNKIALNAGWDGELLATELAELTELLPDLDLDIDLTGFEAGEIDLILSDHEEPNPSSSKEDEIPALLDAAVSRRGDIWQLGNHRLLCGDARDAVLAQGLMDGGTAQMVITDPPYNVKVQGHVGGRGKTKHDEFAFASGEMSDEEFRDFLRNSLACMLEQLAPGALLYIFMDWRHIETLLFVGRELGLIHKNICVWSKTTPGQGSFYRSAHELVVLFAKPGAASTNNVQLGKHGRNRTNVWTYPGVNTFQSGKAGELSLHPTVKPVAMIAEAIKDATKRRDIVLDSFLGSGTALLAAEKVGRRCYGVEYEPKYVDIAIRRWQQMTGKDAVLVQRNGDDNESPTKDDCTFDALSAGAFPIEEVGQ